MSIGSINVPAGRNAADVLLDNLLDRAEPPGPGGDAATPIEFITSAEFARTEYPRRWLVQNVLVAGQPAVIGGPKKALKTNIVADLALSLAARGRAPFLGHFATEDRFRVGLISGESGEATIQETARRIARARRISLEASFVHWAFRMPQLGRDADLAALARQVEDLDLEILIVDPLYLALGGAGVDVQAANLYQIGPLLRDIGVAVLEAGATPVLVHHARKSNPADARSWYQPLELDDLAFAGIGEFTRQWMLISRRVAYDPDTGRHELWLNVGGSAGFSGLYGIDIDEGQVGEDFAGRRWDVRVMAASEAGLQDTGARVERSQVRSEVERTAQYARLRTPILAHLGRHPHGETLHGLAGVVGRNTTVVRPILMGLVAGGEVNEVNDVIKNGRSYQGYRLARPS